MPIKKIFFSYSRVDASDFTKKLAAELGQHGYDIWIDLEDIRAGREWDVEIENALKDCDCLLFFESKHSVVSKNVLDEVYYALEQGKKVIPIIIKDSKTPYRLQRLQHIDFSQDYKKGLNQLLMELNTTGINSTVVTGNKKQESVLSTKNIFLLLFVFIVAATAVFFLSKKNTVDETVKPADKDSVLLVNVDGITGRWNLVEVAPTPREKRGMLNIEATTDGRIQIKSSLQFYYIKNSDTVFLSVFNGFAGCKTCIPTKEIKLETEDVALGWTALKILTNNTTEGKKGDTVMNAGHNQSIAASSSLEFVDDTTALLKVKSAKPITLSPKLVVPEFFYTFTFRKQM